MTNSKPALILLAPLVWLTAPAAAVNLTLPSAPVTPAPSPTPPRAVMVPATLSKSPAAVRVILPAAPPPLPVDPPAALPVVRILPTVRLPAVVAPVVVKVTAPPAVLAVLLWVSMVTPLESIDGARTVMSAPLVVIPVGFTAPIVSANWLEKLTAPDASEAKVLTWLMGTPTLAEFNVKAPVPDNPNLAETIAPV